MVPNDLRELVDGFFSETLDNLDDNEIRISKLSEPGSIDHIEAIFRVFHTLKGLSGFFELYVVQKVTHTAETLLDLMRCNPMPVSPETVDLLYVAFDFLQNALKSTGENYTDELYQEESVILLEQLKIKTQEFENIIQNEGGIVDFNEATSSNLLDEIEKEDTIHESNNESETDPFEQIMAEFTDTTVLFLKDFQKYSDKLSKSYNPELLNKMSSTLSSLKANSSLLELKSVNSMVRGIETVVEYHKANQIEFSPSINQLLNESAILLETILKQLKKTKDDSSFKNDVMDLCEFLTQDLHNESDDQGSNKSNSPELSIQEIAIEMSLVFAKIEKDENDFDSINLLLSYLITLSNTDLFKTNSELNDIILSITSIVDSVANKEINAGAIISVIKSDVKIICQFIGNTYSDSNSSNSDDKNTKQKDSAPIAKVELKTLAEAQIIVEQQTPKEFIKSDADKAITAERKEVRVSTDKLNKLFDLVGEIITIESMVVNNKNLQGLKLPDFQIAAGMLNKLIRELQKITMSIRMIPLEGMFNKMSRLLRDLSRKFGKNIELEINGQETEMDKNVIEQLSDPLVHMIRNSIDHGIEDEHQRLDAGKNPIGKIILGASYQGNEIHITVEDDGAGLNRTKLIEKAQSRGLFYGNPADLSDKQVWQFVFEPGLSTAKEVTDVSGRGVGMDVVKKNIEKLRGTIDIESRTGFGTKITFRIPLTLAIMDAMLIRVGVSKYALPILSVRESFQPKTKDITMTMDGIEVVKVRNELYPVVRLHEIFGRKPDNYDLDRGILMMLNSHEKKVCLFVDEILGQQQAVVKPLSEYIGDVEGITGCMVMADGKIGLIIDVDSLINKAENFTK